MSETKKPEVWQRGPVQGVPPLLQPVAHALLQAQEEIHDLLDEVDSEWFLWSPPLDEMASTAFHLQHIVGVLDRLFTYAKGETLTQQQLHYLNQEGKENKAIKLKLLLDALDFQIEQSIFQLMETDETKLLDARGIGRKQIPTNILGLLFHAAEHTMRHTGQLLITAKTAQSIY